MIVLGLDISSTSTGWAFLDNDKNLLNYGLVKPESSMGTIQKLYFFGNEIKKIIEQCKPDEIAIEETILVRGPKIMRVLARFSGVALFQAYAYQKRDVKTYEPQIWKKALGLSGNANKPNVQLTICENFDLLEKDKIKEYKDELEKIEEEKVDLRRGIKKEFKKIETEAVTLDKHYKLWKRTINKKKKKDVTSEDRKKIEDFELELKRRKEEISIKKKEVNTKAKALEKRIEKVSINIYSDCGINPDIADSIGVALTCMNETK